LKYFDAKVEFIYTTLLLYIFGIKPVPYFFASSPLPPSRKAGEGGDS
jgi:hypothetical protein